MIEIVKLVAEYGILVVIGGVFVALTISMFKKQQDLIERLLNEKIKQGEHPSGEDVEVLDEINDKIYQEMRGIMNDLSADRSYVFLYHNGGSSTSGLFFQRMSCICEVVNLGILPMVDSRQGLHRASYATLCDELKNKEYVAYPDAHSLKGVDDFIYQEILSRHAYAVYFKSLVDSNNNVIGFVGVDFCSTEEMASEKEIEKLLRSVSLKISPLVDIKGSRS